MSEHDQREDYDDEPWRTKPDLARMVRGPASIMAAFGMIQFGFSILGTAALAVALVWSWIDPTVVDDLPWYVAVLGIVASGLVAGLNLIVIRGATRMRQFRSYRLAVWSAVLSLLSIPFYYCCFLTVPVGIWALIVLLRRDVRARFEAVARGTIAPSQPEVPDA